MKILYWSLKSIPELSALSGRERLRAWFACVHKTAFHWQTWLGCGAALGPYLILAILIVCFGLPDPEPEHSFLLKLLIPVVAAMAVSIPGTVLFTHIQAEVIRPYLREYLAGQSQ
jgi:hypothetical protein